MALLAVAALEAEPGASSCRVMAPPNDEEGSLPPHAKRPRRQSALQSVRDATRRVSSLEFAGDDLRAERGGSSDHDSLLEDMDWRGGEGTADAGRFPAPTRREGAPVEAVLVPHSDVFAVGPTPWAGGYFHSQYSPSSSSTPASFFMPTADAGAWDPVVSFPADPAVHSSCALRGGPQSLTPLGAPHLKPAAGVHSSRGA